MATKRGGGSEMDVDAVLDRVSHALVAAGVLVPGDVLDIPQETVRTWRKRGRIPASRLLQWSTEAGVPVEQLVLGSAIREVKNHRPPQTQGNSSPDLELLAETLSAVLAGLQHARKSLPPRALAKLVVLVYEQEAAHRATRPEGSGDLAGTAKRFLQLVKAG